MPQAVRGRVFPYMVSSAAIDRYRRKDTTTPSNTSFVDVMCLGQENTCGLMTLEPSHEARFWKIKKLAYRQLYNKFCYNSGFRLRREDLVSRQARVCESNDLW